MKLLVLVAPMIPVPGEAPVDYWTDTRYDEEVREHYDRFLPARFLPRVARERLAITPNEIDSGHTPALSRPKELADYLEAYVAELGMASG